MIALEAGRLIKKPCERCNSIHKVEGHHEDYSKPLEVVWLCKSCHVARHAELDGANMKPTDTIETALVWKCRQCGFRWLVDDLAYPPKRCASSRCRATAWYRPKLKSGRPKMHIT
jgi:rubrerythrin